MIQSHITSIQNLTYLGAGLGAMTIARSPNGLVSQFSGLVDRFRRRVPVGGDGGSAEVEIQEEVDRVVAPVG